MQNSLSDFSFIEANLYESLEEAHEYIDERTVGMDAIDSHTVYVDYPGNIKFVDSVAFIDLFRAFYDNNDPMYSKGLCQEDGRRL